jgi:hypothetical protein
VLAANAIEARFMAREKARQLIGRHQEIDGGDDQKDDAEQSQYQLHGGILIENYDNLLSPPLPWRQAWPGSSAAQSGDKQIFYQPEALANAGAAAALAFYNFVALLQEALALAILALLLLLDVGTFLACHDVLHPVAPPNDEVARRNPVHSTNAGATG